MCPPGIRIFSLWDSNTKKHRLNSTDRLTVTNSNWSFRIVSIETWQHRRWTTENDNDNDNEDNEDNEDDYDQHSLNSMKELSVNKSV